MSTELPTKYFPLYAPQFPMIGLSELHTICLTRRIKGSAIVTCLAGRGSDTFKDRNNHQRKSVKGGNGKKRGKRRRRKKEEDLRKTARTREKESRGRREDKLMFRTNI